MDPSSSKGIRLENKSTPEPPTWKLGTNPCLNLFDEHSSQELDTTILDPSFSNGFRLENKPTLEPPTWELGTNPCLNLFDDHSSQELHTTIMDPSSSNGFRLDNKLTLEPPTWELGKNPCLNLFDDHSSQELDITIMDPSSSNGFRLENKPTPEPPSLELGTYQCLNLFDQHSSQELDTIQVAHPLENPVPFSNEAKERYFCEALGKKYPPSTQQESPSFKVSQYVDDDDANNTDEGIIENFSHSKAKDSIYVSMQEFDNSVWMYEADEKLAADMATMEITGSNIMQSAVGVRIRTKKRNNREKDEVVDLRTLLIDCSKSVSSGDHLTTNDLLKEIRQHSSPYGDRDQRLAHYFANGLEARLAGTPHSKIHKIIDSSDYLRAYRVSYSSSMIRKIFSFASNETIVIKSKKESIIHVIDFGVLYGIQWPSFIRRVSGREGGPPKKLRITGVDFPQMAEIIEDTGRRLAYYAEELGVPFEYKAIAREWETIKIDDLKIEKDEFVAVVCSIRSMKLLDEAVCVAESPRSMFLNLVREINPNIFVHMILNGTFNQPFFAYRFRDLLLHHLALFDMLETIVPREKPERMMVERDLLGQDILNAIACEGPERDQRPETYRQWQVRHLKAGFMKVPFESKFIDFITCKVGNLYHKEFSVFEKSKWMMMSWKGRTIHAISCWQPANA